VLSSGGSRKPTQEQSNSDNKNNAAAVAALFTEDGVLLASDGMFSGRQDIEKRVSSPSRSQQQEPELATSERRRDAGAPSSEMQKPQD
jgi:hypothetical protein